MFINLFKLNIELQNKIIFDNNDSFCLNCY